MRKLLSSLLISTMLMQPVYAAGGFSSGGGGGARGGFSSSSGARPSAPSTASRPSTTTTTTTTHTTRSSSYSYGGRYISPYGGYYGGFGPAYGYNNGLLTGLIIADMMHPHGTVLYTGPGMYANNALLYPDGRVVNNQGILIGNYINGVFVPIQNGAMVAQPIPHDAQQQPQQQVVQQPTPIHVNQQEDTSGLMMFAYAIGILVLIFIIALIIL